MKRTLTSILILTLLLFSLVGCKADVGHGESETAEAAVSEAAKVDMSQADKDMFTDRDMRSEYEKDKCVLITLNGTSASASSDSVKISGTTVTITEEAAYLISGRLEDGMIIVNTDDSAKPQLILNGVNINSESSAPLYIREADKVFVTLADGTANTLSNGGEFAAVDENNIDAAIFSKQDLTFNGSGSLKVTSPAGHGIVCKDDLVITGGDYTVDSASHGLDANDSVRITGETSLTIDAGKDGIHCENSDDASRGFIYISDGVMNIEAEGDCIDAGAYLKITDGAFELLAGGGSVNGTKKTSDHFGGFKGGRGGMRPGGPQDMATTVTEENGTSMKGIKAAADIHIGGGTFNINSADDSVHSNTSITVFGGSFELASGDDAFHADDTLTVTDGTIDISESYEGLEALHVDIQGGSIRVTASDDGLNAAGGTDGSGMTGGRDGMFGGRGPGMSSGNGSIVISGGELYINASGDGIDANGTLEITGGHTVVCGPTKGDTSILDYDKSAVISGGTFIGTGAAGMTQTFSDSKQGVISLSVGNQNAKTEIILRDKSGNTLITNTPELSYAVVILSCPQMISGETYTAVIGSQSGEFTAS